jgi:UTP--glucose-1-phosphate uridylyltransferase
MKEANLPAVAIDAFEHYYGLLIGGETGTISDRNLEPLPRGSLREYSSLDRFREEGMKALRQTAVIKLNGGLGTSMGLEGPKCLLPARDGMTFLEITFRQLMRARLDNDARIPLVLMNSFNTSESTERFVQDMDPELSDNVSQFLQHRFPKILSSDLSPARWPENPLLEWNPPGHGDIYPSLFSTGILHRLTEQGFRYAFVSNIDNLGATLDPAILGYVAENRLPFLMEVVERTEMHKKGGHLARLRDSGRLVLREVAQVSKEEIDSFQDIEKYHYFNSNNIWLDLVQLEKLLLKSGGFVALPLIANAKHLDPRDDGSPAVYQLETAMGAAISQFAGSEAIAVPMVRYAPVKKTNDLALLRSDRFTVSDDFVVREVPTGSTPHASVSLDSRYYGKYDQLDIRFARGVPSLRECTSLSVTGDVHFGSNVTIRGAVRIENASDEPLYIADNAVVDNDIEVKAVPEKHPGR